MGAMASMKKVAARANVSISTVSRVVNQSGYLASNVRENVLKAMKKLNYEPSAIARGLRRRSTESIGVLVPQMAQPFFGAIGMQSKSICSRTAIARFYAACRKNTSRFLR
jgi:DNA-binding LacI/PurR family transcriptional regulator